MSLKLSLFIPKNISLIALIYRTQNKNLFNNLDIFYVNALRFFSFTGLVQMLQTNSYYNTKKCVWQLIREHYLFDDSNTILKLIFLFYNKNNRQKALKVFVSNN